MTANKKTWMLWGALIITLWLVWKTEPSDDLAVVKPSSRLDSHLTEVHSNASQGQLALVARKPMPSVGNLFTTPIVAPAEQLKKTATKPPPPMAPPLPFKYLGRWKENGLLTVMLLANDEVMAVKQGDQLLNAYEVKELTESNSGLMVGLMYLPLKQMQFLDVGKAKNE